MRVRPSPATLPVALLAVCAAAAPVAAGAQAGPLPFVGATTTYTAFGCGTGLLGGDSPPVVEGPALCLRGTVTVGAVPAAGAQLFQFLFDLDVERQPGSVRPFSFVSGAVDLRWVSTQAPPLGGPRERTNVDFSSAQSRTTETHLTAWPALLPFAEQVAPNSLELTAARLFFDSRNPAPDASGPYTTTVRLALATVSEPGTWALLGTGLLALGALGRRRHRPSA